MGDAPETAKPATTRQVADVIAWANAGRRALRIGGAGTKHAIGLPFRFDLDLDLSALDQVIAYEPGELVLTAGPGARIAEIEALLAGHGQRLAFEPPDLGPLLGAGARARTLGGAVGSNASGPRRLRAGAARDHLLGFEAVSGRAEPFRGGGRVVKNVTGYDLPKLMTGSWGTLAALTEVTFKTVPAPPDELTLSAAAADAGAAVKAMSRALSRPIGVTGAAYAPGGPAGGEGARVLVRLEGSAPAIAAAAERLRGDPAFADAERIDAEASRTLWAWIRDVGAFVGTEGAVWRLVLPPSEAPAAVAEIAGRTACDALYDWAGGLVWMRTAEDFDAARQVRAAAAARGGQALLVRGSSTFRAAAGVFPEEAAPLEALARRIKAGFDPAGVLNPGRLRPEERTAD